MKPDLPSAAVRRESGLALASLMASGFAWGLIWWPLKFFAGAGLTGHGIALTAYALVTVVSLPWIWRERAAWRDEARLLFLIGLFFGCANIAFTSAMMTGSVVRAMLLFYLLPAWGAIGGRLFLNERIGPRRLAAIVLSLGGVFVILGGSAVFRQAFSFADATALIAGMSYTAAGIANRKAVAIPMASRTLVSFAGCTLLALAGLLFSVPAVPTLALSTWLLLTLFAFAWLLGGTLLTTYGVTHVAVSRAAVLQVLELLVAVISAIWIGGEALDTKEWIGGAMVLTATLIEATNRN